METSAMIEMMKNLLVNGLIIIAPSLIATLVVAVIFGILQAIMQIQEQTLSFFPKLLILLAVFYFLGPWMFEKMIEFIKDYIQSIPNIL